MTCLCTHDPASEIRRPSWSAAGGCGAAVRGGVFGSPPSPGEEAGKLRTCAFCLGLEPLGRRWEGGHLSAPWVAGEDSCRGGAGERRSRRAGSIRLPERLVWTRPHAGWNRGYCSLWPLAGGRALGGMDAGLGAHAVPTASSGRPPPGQVKQQVLRLRSGVGLLEAPCVGCRSVPRVRWARGLGLLSPGAALSATLPLPLGRNRHHDFVAVVFSVFLPVTIRLCLF